MQAPKGTWVQDTTRYGSGHIYRVPWAAGRTDYNSARTADDPNKWRASVNLAGLKSEHGHYATEAEAMARVVQVVEFWFSKVEG